LGDDSFQSIICTGTDILTRTTRRKRTKRNTKDMSTNWP